MRALTQTSSETGLKTVLIRIPVAVKTHRDYGNSYKTKHFIGAACLQSFSLLSSWWDVVAHRQTWCWRSN